jgi:S1-C subfamily serine protease
MVFEGEHTIRGWWAMAVGTPDGLEGSVSIGNVMNTEAIGDVVSTTPLNSGNPGGPLVNSRGEVIGTNTEIYIEDYAQNWNIARGIPLLCNALVSCEDEDGFSWE